MIQLKPIGYYIHQLLSFIAIVFSVITVASLIVFLYGKLLGDQHLAKLGFWDLKIIGFSGGLIFFSILYLGYEKLSQNKKLFAWGALILGIALGFTYIHTLVF